MVEKLVELSPVVQIALDKGLRIVKVLENAKESGETSVAIPNDNSHNPLEPSYVSIDIKVFKQVLGMIVLNLKSQGFSTEKACGMLGITDKSRTEQK